MTKLKLRALRPLHFGGKLVQSGEIFSVDAAAAAEALTSTRCELVDEADLPVMLSAAGKAVLDQLGRHGRQAPYPGSPWRPMN